MIDCSLSRVKTRTVYRVKKLRPFFNRLHVYL